MAKLRANDEFQTDMKDFERRLKQVRAEYNQHLAGVLSTAPNFSVAMIRKIIRKYAGDRSLKGVQKFRYYNLVAKFNTMMEFYNRRLRDMEMGRATTYGYVKSSEELQSDRVSSMRREAMKNDKGHIIANANQQNITVRKMYDKWNDYAADLETAPANMDYDRFKKIINHKTNQILKEKKCRAVNYKLTISDGKIKIQAKPIK